MKEKEKVTISKEHFMKLEASVLTDMVCENPLMMVLSEELITYGARIARKLFEIKEDK